MEPEGSYQLPSPTEEVLIVECFWGRGVSFIRYVIPSRMMLYWVVLYLEVYRVT